MLQFDLILALAVLSISLTSIVCTNPYYINGRESKLSKILERGSQNRGPIDPTNHKDIQERIKAGLNDIYRSNNPFQLEPKMKLNPNPIAVENSKPKATCARCQVGTIAIYCYCYGDDFDFREQFQNISQELNTNNASKNFFMADMWNFGVEEIPENAFLDITFEEVFIDNPISLQRLHRNAFNGTTNELQGELFLWGGSSLLLQDQPNSDYDMWAAFSSLNNVQFLFLTFGYGMAHEIPNNAFRQINGPQNNLLDIVFEIGYNISRVGEYAFSQLTNLNDGTIDMSFIPIEHISPHAFDFAYENDRYVYVDLRYCSLTENSFDTGSFIGRNRPLIVYLSHNNIRYIRQEVFEDFFEGDHRSLLFIDDNPLNCDDTDPFRWLLLAPNRNELMARIIYPYCANGTELWHIDVGPLPTTAPPSATAPPSTTVPPATTPCSCPNTGTATYLSCINYVIFANLISFITYKIVVSY